MRRIVVFISLLASSVLAQEPAEVPHPAGDAPPAPRDPSDPPDLPAPQVDPVAALPHPTPTPSPPPTTAPTSTSTSTDPADPRAVLVRLVYSPGRWDSVCPSLLEVRSGIQQHLGYDPFGEPAHRVVLLLLDGEGDAPQRARVEMLDRDLQSLGARTVTSSEGCADLIATAQLQVSIAVDPSRVSGPGSRAVPGADPPAPAATIVDPAVAVVDIGVAVAPVVPAAVPAVPAAVPAAEAPPALKFDPLGLATFVGVNAHITALLTPQPFMLGGALFAGVRAQWWSGRLEMRLEVPADDTGTTSVPILASAVPCLHLPIGPLVEGEQVEVVGCVTATTGIIPTVGALQGLGVYAGFGGRSGFDWHLNDSSVRIFFQVEGAAVRTRFTAASGAVFITPPVNILLGIGVDLPSL